jgi:hypothetical protein
MVQTYRRREVSSEWSSLVSLLDRTVVVFEADFYLRSKVRHYYVSGREYARDYTSQLDGTGAWTSMLRCGVAVRSVQPESTLI